MDHSKGLSQNLDEFKKMTIELANAGENEKLRDENEAIILLNSLPESFKDVKAAIKYALVQAKPNEEAEVAHSDGSHQVEGNQNQPEINEYLVDYELVKDRARRIIKPNCFVDSDYTGDRDKRRSTSSYFFTIAGCCVSWKSQLQSVVALSTTAAEYITVTEEIKEAIWLQEDDVLFGGKTAFDAIDYPGSFHFAHSKNMASNKGN
ncbi:hypothetical protein EZV62_007361 [Acer yangbiense]|uniref:Reverse transcriptase Ty1/copia-type domain-containing protein n=1 Tax=Acer yangbiense TaxID=1000413 RepID=A0A5C7IC98_9ROSI|nr:hypothetical protein EZV62_007361 [Acer yangbiense]